MKKKISRPNSSQCEGCPDWDDINGCWRNIRDVDSCDMVGDDGYYDSGDEDDDQDLILEQCSCRYCNCLNETEGGVVCNECLSGSHQG